VDRMMNRYHKLFLILIGFLLVLCILYYRLIQERLPREFSEIFLIFKIFTLSLMLVLLIVNLVIYYKENSIKNNEGKYTIYIKKLYNHPYNPIHFIINSITEFDAFIKNNSSFYDEHDRYSDVILRKIAFYLFNTAKKVILMITFFRLIPQIIVCICFLTDILIYDKFYLFYKSLWLLIFLLIINYIIYSLKIIVEVNLQEVNETLSLRIISHANITNDTTYEDYTIIDVYEWQQLLLTEEGNDYVCYNTLSKETELSFNNDLISARHCLEYTVDFMNILFQINKMILDYNNYKLKIEIPFNIFKYSLYFIGWLYISL
jgi:hypothetical protein